MAIKRKSYTTEYTGPIEDDELDEEPTLRQLGFAINEQGDLWNFTKADFAGAVAASRSDKVDSGDLFWLHFVIGKRHVRIRLKRDAMRGLMRTMLALRDATKLDD